MDPSLIKAVIKSNVMEKNSSTTHKYAESVVSLSSSADEDDFEKNTFRSPEGGTRGKSVKEIEEQINMLKKENFHLKLRLFFYEENLGPNFNAEKEDIVKQNVSLKVEVESQKKELEKKHELLCDAVKAMELEEDQFKEKLAQRESAFAELQREHEDLKLQLQDFRYDNDNDSTHKSYHSEPIFLSSPLLSIPESSGTIKLLQEKISFLERELDQEKENNASFQLALDAANLKIEEFEAELAKKDADANDLIDKLNEANEIVSEQESKISDLKVQIDQIELDNQLLTGKFSDKSKQAEELESRVRELKDKYATIKTEAATERQRFEMGKLSFETKIREADDECKKHRAKVHDLQKKLAAVHEELKSNQNLLVSKSLHRNSSPSHTDVGSFLVSNSATSPRLQKTTALRDELKTSRTSGSHLTVLSPSATAAAAAAASPSPFDFERLEKAIKLGSNNRLIQDQFTELKTAHLALTVKAEKLKTEQFQACAIIKAMIDAKKKTTNEKADMQTRIRELESELEGVVSKPSSEKGQGEQVGGRNTRREKSATRSSDTERHVEIRDDKISEGTEDYQILVQELEKKIEILVLTLKEKDVQLTYIQEQNEEMLENLRSKEKQILDFENRSQSAERGDSNVEKMDEGSEKDQSIYRQLIDEKDKEIDKLNSELKKRTYDLQAIVNNELWEKNREIEKLQTKFNRIIEQKEQCIASLSKHLELSIEEKDECQKIIEERDLQLKILKEKIGELGIVEVEGAENLNSDVKEIKVLQDRLDTAIKEKKYFQQKIEELETKVGAGDATVNLLQDMKIENLQKQYDLSEKLRLQTNEVCTALSSRLEELAVFLDSLMKQKSILGFLGSSQNEKLRHAIDQSLNLSKSLSMSFVNNDQSLAQLSNITALLNGSTFDNNATCSQEEDTNLSIETRDVTLTYQSHIYKSKDVEEPREMNKGQIITTLRAQIVNLQHELQLRDVELNKLNNGECDAENARENKDFKIVYESKPRISPNKNRTSSTLVYRSDSQSESDEWSEPDINVSKARIGLFNDSLSGIKEVQSTDSTEDDRFMGKKDVIMDYKENVVKLSEKVDELSQKLSEKDVQLSRLSEVQETASMLLEENDQIKERLAILEPELQGTKSSLCEMEGRNFRADAQIRKMEKLISELEKTREECVAESKNKLAVTQDELNRLKIENEELMEVVKHAEVSAADAKLRMVDSEVRFEKLAEECESMKTWKELYQKETETKLKKVENEFALQIKQTKEREREIGLLNESILELKQEYSKNYVKKSEMNAKVAEIAKLRQELQHARDSLNRCQKIIESRKEDDMKFNVKVLDYQDKINKLYSDLENATFQYSEAVLEKTKVANEKISLEQELNKMNGKEADLRTQLGEIHSELNNVKNNFLKQVTALQDCKSKLDVKVSRLEAHNAELVNRLVKIQNGNGGDGIYSTSLPVSPNRYFELNGRSPAVHRRNTFERQHSDGSCLSSDEPPLENTYRRGIMYHNAFTVGSAAAPSIDIERNEANSSPDLGIESDQGRFSSLEIPAGRRSATTRPLLHTLELTESINNSLADRSTRNITCENKVCLAKSLELCQENISLKKKLVRTRKALEETVTQLSLANQRKRQVEKTICSQIHKTSQVLRKAKANLDSGSETDVTQH